MKFVIFLRSMGSGKGSIILSSLKKEVGGGGYLNA